MKKEFDCIVCPMSCHLIAEQQQQEIKVYGNRCPRGAAFAKQEMIEPMRMFTSTVRIQDALYPLLPVITSQSIPKTKLFEVIAVCKALHVQAPIEANEILVKNVAGTNADLLASRSMERRYVDETNSIACD